MTPSQLTWPVFLGLAIPGSALVWAVGKFLFKPLILSLYRQLGRRVFKSEWAEQRRLVEAFGELEASFNELHSRLHQVEADMEGQAEHLQRLPAIEQGIHSSIEASTRTERAIGRLSQQILTLAQQVGQVQGAQGKPHG
jgi:hypothetical protein